MNAAAEIGGTRFEKKMEKLDTAQTSRKFACGKRGGPKVADPKKGSATFSFESQISLVADLHC